MSLEKVDLETRVAAATGSDRDANMDLSDPRIRVLLLDDEKGSVEVLAGKVKLTNVVIHHASRQETAYSLLLTRPFGYDAVVVDYWLSNWPPLSNERAVELGLPDSIRDCVLFPRAVHLTGGNAAPARVDLAEQGGHAEMMVSLAASHGSTIVVFSQKLSPDHPDVWKLRARGAQLFVEKKPTTAGTRDLTALLLSHAALRRDKRMWRSLPLTDLQDILTHVSSLSAEGIASLVSKYTDMSVEEKHRLVGSVDRDVRLHYLIGSLGWLREPRLFCAQRLISIATQLFRKQGGADGEAERLIGIARVLQPSAPLPVGSGRMLEGGGDDKPDQRIRHAHNTHRLDKGVEHLHILVDRALRRTDYFASLDGARSAPLAIDYLGTTFAPRLASSIDQNGVLPAAKLSKLKHLMRAPRTARVVHQGPVATRCADGVFGPTIDTLLMGEVLLHIADRSTGLLGRDCSVVELGVGTGHLMGLVAATAGSRLRMILGSDVCPRALATAQLNMRGARPKPNMPRDVHFVLSDSALNLLNDESIDMIVTNPPYLPERPSPETQATSGTGTTATAGKELIRHILVDEGARVLKKNGFVLMVTSTLTRQVLAAAIEDAKQRGVAWHHVRLRVLSWVPLDLPEVHENYQWVERLLQEGAEHVQFDVAASEYPLRHGVVVTAFSLSKDRTEELAQLGMRTAG